MKAKKTPPFHYWVSGEFTISHEPLVAGSICFFPLPLASRYYFVPAISMAFAYCPTTGQIW